MEQESFVSYLVELNLHSLFSLTNEFDDYFVTKQYVDNTGLRIYGELAFNLLSSGITVKISHIGLHINGWTIIEGSLPERRLKILEYLVENGYAPANSFLREHKIDCLIHE